MTQPSRPRTTPTTGPRLVATDESPGHREQRTALRLRHIEGLTRLLGSRDDLRGVHALADLRDDAVRWSA